MRRGITAAAERNGTAALRREVARLRAALEAIRDDPHQSYQLDRTNALMSESLRQYTIGVADGHRCAALTARRALDVDTNDTEEEKR